MHRLSIAAVAAVFTVAFTQIASAADLPVKAPVYKAPVAAPYNWTGFYVGGNVGYSWGNSDTDTTYLAPPINLALAHSNSVKPSGVIGGGQIGYNWQVSLNWVFGLEADWQASGEKASGSISDQFNTGLAFGVVDTRYEAKITWFGTLRGRIGYAWDRLLFYGTGGLAYGQVKPAGTTNIRGIDAGGPFNVTTPFSASNVNTGWTLGAGIEGAIAGSWTWKAEYLYMDLGKLDASTIDLAYGGPIRAHAHFTDNIVRVGFNYRFN